MRLYDEIFKSADGVACTRCIFIPEGGGYFEGVKYVEDFSAEKVVLRFSHKSLEIEGKALSIAKYCDGDLQIGGKIVALRVLMDSAAEQEKKRGEE